ncbi:MAG TPA: DegT/DnrJ/EryC1/StrS aminotransferase family protein [Syntrophomonadaceae bacterium]|nr:DegT/DnrJ/EryC1/StrS aminotransferase family protein [Syntrophomonadaceae bacterium]
MKNIPFGKPIIGDEERQAVLKVLSGTTLTHGPLVKDFEVAFAQFVGVEHTIAVSSCTAALHLAYFYLGLGSGDEVIVPAQTHAATAHAVELCGARAVFVDAEKETGNIDIDQIENKITEHTKAISVVHYLGMPVDMDRIMDIAKKHRLFVVEDCALAIGTYFNGEHAGLKGDVGCFSFYPVKHITTAEGGMLVTRNPEIAGRISMLRAFGIDRNIVSERKIPGMYDVEALGFNYRMNEIGAAIGLEQMKRIPGFLKQRRENYAALSRGLNEIEEVEILQSSHDNYQSSYYCHSMILREPLANKRYNIMQYLQTKGVGTSIYYPQPVPYMSYYRNKYDFSDKDFPVAKRLSSRGIALPVGPHLNIEDMEYIVEIIKNAINEVK